MKRPATTPATTVRGYRKADIHLTRGGGGYYKRIAGKLHWLGKDEATAQAKAAQLLAAHYAGKEVVVATGSPSIESLCNLFLEACESKVRAKSPELSRRTYDDYLGCLQMACDHFGKSAAVGDISPGDWGKYRSILAARYSPHRIALHVRTMRGLSSWAVANEHTDTGFRFGTQFSPPDERTFRSLRVKRAREAPDANTITVVIDYSDAILRALVVMGLNGCMGNSDIAALRLRDITDGWIDTTRSKTIEPRRFKLWPETIDLLAPLLVGKGPNDLIFTTSVGTPLVSLGEADFVKAANRKDYIAERFRHLVKRLQKAGVLKGGVTFYDMRRHARTVAEGAGETQAARLIMGHASSSARMDDVYVQRVDDASLERVGEHVRKSIGIIGCSFWPLRRLPVVVDAKKGGALPKTPQGRGGRSSSGAASSRVKRR